MASIYVASSWRNPYYPEVVKRLKAEGHDVYDFRNPPHGGTGFHWTDVDENAPNWTFEQYAEGLPIRWPSANLRPIWRPCSGQIHASSSSLVDAVPTPRPAGWQVKENV